MSAVDDERIALAADAERPLRPIAVAWAPVLAWMALIVFLSGDRFADVNTATWLAGMPFVGAFGISPAVIAVANLIVRKCAHFVEYAVLSMLSFRAARATWPSLRRRELFAAAVGLAALFAGFDELRQYAVTTSRSGTPRDVALDAVGALTGATMGARSLYRRVRSRRA